MEVSRPDSRLGARLERGTDRRIRTNLKNRLLFRLGNKQKTGLVSNRTSNRSSVETAMLRTRRLVTPTEDQDVSLITSWLLDTAADTHVGDDSRNFRKFRPAHDSPLTRGNTGSSIVGFGEVVIMTQYGTLRREFTLKDIAYVPGFHPNLCGVLCRSSPCRDQF
ncbi:hypothetical protein V1525DRAFT_271311 [Lipomyces kononenkoae]|uniref:Uncharacterized protein n=1 Tax=Lipomyces kononenkoae TaxID=34357 RepID=A0ACC3SUU1_LIPKO